MHRWNILLFLVLFSPLIASAQEGLLDNSGSTAFIPQQHPTLAITRRTAPIKIDGDLDDEGWQSAQVAENFTEVRPGNQTKPISPTYAQLTYDDEYIYVALRAVDDPSAIRASLTDRDGFYQQDFMGIVIDPFGAATHAYELYANPLGVQGDLIWTGNGDDEGYDMVFDAESKITATGWQTELRIPFSSLRYPGGVNQQWRATFWRVRPRESRYTYSWAAVDFNLSCSFCQFGTLESFESVPSASAFELLPSVIASQSAERGEAGLTNAKFKPDFSLGAKYAPSQSSSIEATFNPDFSQVESDAGQIDVNSNFALFYPERRPFFQEGADLWNTNISSVYTRSINDPIAAAKFVDRSDGLMIGFLSAYDEHSPLLVPLEERSLITSLGKSTVGAIRLIHPMNEDDHIGFLATDRRFISDQSSSSLASVDAQIRLYEQISLIVEGAGSVTRGINEREIFGSDNPQLLTGTTSALGHYLTANISRSTRHLDFSFGASQVSPEFRAATGFVTRSNSKNINFWTGYKIQFSESFFVELRPNVSVGRRWNFDGIRKDEWLEPSLNATLGGQTEFGIHYLISDELYKGVRIDGIRRLSADINSNFSNVLSGGGSVQVGKVIARFPDLPTLSEKFEAAAWSTIRPTDQLIVEPGITYSQLRAPSGDLYYAGTIWRGKLSYQFTRQFFARFVVEYDAFGRNFSMEPLLTYRINPFSLIYIGSTTNLRSEESSYPLRISERQFFAKIQYLIHS